MAHRKKTTIHIAMTLIEEKTSAPLGEERDGTRLQCAVRRNTPRQRRPGGSKVPEVPCIHAVVPL